MSRREMWIAALRRLALLIVGACAITAALLLTLGAILGAGVDRSLTLGFYLTGCALVVAGFFVANRGPARVRGSDSGTMGLFGFLGTRRVRWATLREQSETINSSAVFVTLGLILILVGFAFDAKHTLI